MREIKKWSYVVTVIIASAAVGGLVTIAAYLFSSVVTLDPRIYHPLPFRLMFEGVFLLFVYIAGEPHIVRHVETSNNVRFK